MSPSRAAAIVTASLLVLAAAGCGTSNRSGSGFGAPAPSAPTAPVASSPPTGPAAPSSPSSPPAASPGSSGSSGSSVEADCALTQLAVTDSNGDAGSTHRSTVLVFRNTSATTCHLTGYPGVAGLGPQDQQLAQATRSLSGYLGGAPAVTTVQLTPGQSASATVETLAIDTGTGNSCTPFAGILVTPPNETHSIRLAWPNDGCSSLQVHPVVAGTTGSQR